MERKLDGVGREQLEAPLQDQRGAPRGLHVGHRPRVDLPALAAGAQGTGLDHAPEHRRGHEGAAVGQPHHRAPRPRRGNGPAIDSQSASMSAAMKGRSVDDRGRIDRAQGVARGHLLGAERGHDDQPAVRVGRLAVQPAVQQLERHGIGPLAVVQEDRGRHGVPGRARRAAGGVRRCSSPRRTAPDRARWGPPARPRPPGPGARPPPHPPGRRGDRGGRPRRPVRRRGRWRRCPSAIPSSIWNGRGAAWSTPWPRRTSTSRCVAWTAQLVEQAGLAGARLGLHQDEAPGRAGRPLQHLHQLRQLVGPADERRLGQHVAEVALARRDGWLDEPGLEGDAGSPRCRARRRPPTGTARRDPWPAGAAGRLRAIVAPRRRVSAAGAAPR